VFTKSVLTSGVSGISPNGDNEALVEYQWKWAVNNIGQELVNNQGISIENNIHVGQLLFRRFDDGWRIASNLSFD